MDKLIDNFIKVFSTNVIILIIGILNNFLIPKYLSLSDYALFKTYTFYLGYVAILSLGYVDGLYIKYGGVKLDETNKNELKIERKTFIVLEILFAFIFLFLSYVLSDKLLMILALSILPFNMIGFYKMFYQSVGEFGIYTKLNTYIPIITFLLTLLLIIIGNKNPYWYMGIQVITSTVVLITFMLKDYKALQSHISRKILTHDNFKLFKVGIFTMMGNLSAMLIYSSDRWFVKFFLDERSFAIYSFAIGLMGIVMILINSISSIMYPYFADVKNVNTNYELIYRVFTIIGTCTASAYFILKIIIEKILPLYVDSLGVIGYLFLGIPFIITINSIYINFYKASKKEKRYFLMIVIMLVITSILNYISVIMFESMNSVAISTTIAYFIWFNILNRDLQLFKIKYYDYVFIIIYTIIFHITVTMKSGFNSFVMYIILISTLIFVIYRKYMFKLIDIVICFSKSKL